ncbi:MAG: hypothetical protein OEZ13_08170 [Spirochaetia bacterium]|nr:hypothetical protein [Spirochaetia bacterium]
MYKVLIIDDNHSFIDSLKVMLNEFPFQFESEFRFIDAEKIIREFDSYINRTEIDKINLYQQLKKSETQKEEESNQEDAKEKNKKPSHEIEKPILKKAPINDEGFMFILIEQDTERSLKGLEFIKNILSTCSNFRPEDFILFSTQPNTIEKEALKSGILLIEKPIKYPLLKQNLRLRLKKAEEIVKQCGSIMTNHKIEIVKKERKKTSVTIKEPSKKIKKSPKESSPKPLKNNKTPNKSTKKTPIKKKTKKSE